MLKNYTINGKGWQFEEGEQPEDAIEVNNDHKEPEPVDEVVAPVQKQAEPKNKAVSAPKNKAVKGSKK